MTGFSNHPCFLGLSNIVPLSGFSGAHVAMLDPDSAAIRVRKAAIDRASSDRLRDQAVRQLNLSKVLAGVANVPTILLDGVVDGCYWYDMEYVPGLDAVEYLSVGTRSKIDKLVFQIGAMLEVQADAEVAKANNIHLHARITKKLAQIEANNCKCHALQLNAITAAMPEREIVLSPTIAHGDLTLENILIDRHEQIWIIDTISSPFDHYWIDLAKLFQDLSGRWFLHRGRTLSIGLVRTLADMILRRALALDQQYLNYHHVLLALNFARILPYCKSSEDTEFISSRIDLALNCKSHLQETYL